MLESRVYRTVWALTAQLLGLIYGLGFGVQA